MRGGRVFATPTGASALAIIEKGTIDVILLDIYLPDKSSLDVLKDIKTKYQNVPVIMITAYGL